MFGDEKRQSTLEKHVLFVLARQAQFSERASLFRKKRKILKKFNFSCHESAPCDNLSLPVFSFFETRPSSRVKPSDEGGRLIFGRKKTDTKQGPRRIEIAFSATNGLISEMRIWPETPDHRRMNHTLIQLVSEEKLADNWFMHEFHHPDQRRNG
jgi:hypothetical protein